MIRFFRKIYSASGALIILILSIAPILVAYFLEYVLHMPPCRLCIYQRIPYWFLLFISLISLLLSFREIEVSYKKVYALSLFVYFIGSSVSFFHLGVENGWFYYESVCTFNDAKFSTFAEYRAFIESADLVLCDTRSPLFLGATAAAYNFLYNLFCIFVVYFKFRK